MDLRSDGPHWPAASPPVPSYQPLTRNRRADVLIIGGGITGALVARALVAAGHQCILIDRREIGGGSTSASTALLQYEVDTPLHRLRSLVGPANADRAYQLGVEAIDELAKLATAEWEFRRRPSMLLARDRRSVPGLQREFLARREAGLDVQRLDETETSELGFWRPASLLSAVGAEMNPFRATHALITDATRKGLEAFDRTAAIGYRHDRRGVTVTTQGGQRIRARRVVFATGYETKDILPGKILTITSTYATVTEPDRDLEWWRRRCLVWETGDSYLYARTTSDNRILVGGEDDSTRSPKTRDGRIPAKMKRLAARFKLLTGVTITPTTGWAGAFGHTADGLPYIGAHPAFPSGLFALGFGGNGITFGTLAARMMPGFISGRRDPDAKIFSFDRTSSSA